MKRHSLDPVSLVFGLFFLLAALAFLGGQRRMTDVPIAWLWAVPMLAVGLAAVLAGVKRAIEERRAELGDDGDDGEDGDVGEDGVTAPTE